MNVESNTQEAVSAVTSGISNAATIPAGSFRPEGVAPFTYGLWRHFVLIGALHLVWLFVLLIAQMAGYHGFDGFVVSFLGLGGR